MQRMRNDIMQFVGETVFPEIFIELPLTMGEAPNRFTVLVNFLAIKSPSAYNAILGKPTLNALRVATSTYHLMIKFSTKSGGIG